MTRLPLYGEQFTGTGGTIPARPQTNSRGGSSGRSLSVGQIRAAARNRKDREASQRTSHRSAAAINKSIQQKIRAIEDTMKTPGVTGNAARARQIQDLKKQLMVIKQPQGGSGSDPWAEANAANKERYGQIIGGYNNIISATRDRLNQRSEQAEIDARTEFQALSSANRQDLVSRGLAASTIGQGNEAVYGRNMQASINDARDKNIAQYNATINPLYQNMFGVIERRNDTPPPMGLSAQVNQQAGYGSMTGGYGGGSGFPGEGGGYAIPGAAYGNYGSSYGGGSYGGGTVQRQPQVNQQMPINPIFAAAGQANRNWRNEQVKLNPIFRK
jgi:hypothetical protein